LVTGEGNKEPRLTFLSDDIYKEAVFMDWSLAAQKENFEW